ncbi:HNH endonuclease signature motif containing protein [Caballeronia sp. dw_19]|uniref:HNH endonuclease signature motif containing protein n=1 Tax=Caballeronia sp. dw_19 TaxID=2719791 RepID=UPI001BD3BE3B|nr:HNH endonuclease signature motif containing protein [Caballeronia sp. dw_19]
MPESRTSTKRVLEDIGFVRPGGTRSQFWYALDAGKQTIVFTSWVKKANAARTEVQFINVSQPPSKRDPVNLKAARSRVLSIIAEKESYPGGMFMALGEEGPKHANLAPAEGLDLYPIFRFEVRGGGIVAFLGDPLPAAAIAASTDPILQDPRFGEIRLRPDQIAFRKAVFGRHGVRCKISGCVEPALLDAAHLPGRDWKLGHNTAADGIPLRADLHRALDAGLIALDENYRLCWMDERLVDAYGDLLPTGTESR